ncbi:hypothetical protein SEUCBS140593_007818 [Sporothrix eucalyptigena]|uniref:DNA-directed RNA polymerase II subunit RPB9-like zinc ribbon domain-containing protein n=1 Tax=Sporothrix eucalyptigena TaxID=1812306 RepID=A0ABP0CHQ1_9PEZI
MSSPQSTTSHEGGEKKNLEQITFRFCAECSNMLYPKEDEDSHKLQFTCRTCQYTEEAASTCVFRNVLNNAAGETAGVTQDVGSDPTVGAPSHSSHSSISPLSPCTLSSIPQSKAVLCFCCGTVIACRSCGELFCKPPSSPTMTTDATTTMTNDAVFSPTLCDLDDLDLYPDDDFLAECSDDSGYEFMEGTEYGNREEFDEMIAV